MVIVPEGVIGRFRAIPENLKDDFSEFKETSLTSAMYKAWVNFGRANREMLKTIGEGIRR